MMASMDASPRTGDIVFTCAVAFLLGVFVAGSGWDPVVVVALAGCIAAGIIVLYGTRGAKWIAIALFAFVAGILYYYGYVDWQAAHTRLPSGKAAAFFGVITEEPKLAGNFIMLPISLVQPYAGEVDIFVLANNTQFSYGDEIWIQGTVTASKDAGEPSAIFLPKLNVIAQHQGFWFKESVINFKEAIVRKIAQLLPPDQAALLAGILIGTTSAVSAALKAQMEASGTTYIVNMYGYKIAIMTAAIAMALKDHMSRKALLWISLVAIGLFVFASGGATSAIRAAVMGAFAVVARGTGRVFSARNAVTFAALGMVLGNATLLTDAGFQLSFLSFLGIYYIGPAINGFFHWAGRGALDWKSHAMLSLATNLAILPIVMNTFGEFSLTSFISNILIMIPWVAVIGFGAIAVLFGFISPALAFIATQIVSVFLQYELFIIRVFAEITIPIPPLFGSGVAVALYYAALIIFAHYYASSSQENN
jgi:ComEC/Rec2-related protein